MRFSTALLLTFPGDSCLSIVLPSFIEFIGISAFKGCASLESLEMQMDLGNLETESYIFRGCKKISHVKFPFSFRTKGTSWFKSRFDPIVLPIIAFDSNMPDGLLPKYLRKDVDSCLASFKKLHRTDLLMSFLEFGPGCDIDFVDIVAEKAAELKSKEMVAIAESYKKQHFSDEDIARNQKNKSDKEAGISEYTVADWKKVLKFKTQAGSVYITGYKNNQKAALIPAKIGRTSVSTIDMYAFENSAVEKVIISDGVKTISQGAFCQCKDLKYVVIPPSVETIDNYVFSQCSSLESITIPESVANIGVKAFQYCKSLKSVIFLNSATQIENGLFSNCTSLTDIIVPSGATSIEESMFENCTALKNVTIPQRITKITNKAFAGCTSLETVTILNADTVIHSGAFCDCEALESVIFPEGVNINEASSLFQNCVSLKSFVVPDGTECINFKNFENCKSLADVIIPSSVKNIGKKAFHACEGLKNITLPDSVEEISEKAFC